MAGDAELLPSGARLEVVAETTSTNADAMAMLADGTRCPLWILAESQSGGRGRGGKSWISQRGNLMASFGFQSTCEPAQATQLSFVAGLAVRDVVCDLLGDRVGWDDARASLKWPNDVLVDRAKIAGILVETSRFSSDGPLSVVIGIGLNVAKAPELADQPTTSLSDIADASLRRITPQDVLHALDGRLADWLDRWDHTRGWQTVRSAWLAGNGLIGARLEIADDAGAKRRGIFRGLSPHGALLLDMGTETMEITFGDVALVD